MKKETTGSKPKKTKKTVERSYTINRKITYQAMEKAIKGSFGIVATVARKLKCERLTVYNWLDKYPELATLLQNEREDIVDLAESALIANVRAKKETSVNFTLKMLGHKRGYKDKTEVESSNFELSTTILEKLPDEYLDRIANGESPKQVIAEYYAVERHTNKSNG